jgi:hypothetical protein
MICVKVECDTGNYWTTAINGTFAEAMAYFIGQTFVRENPVTGEETPDTVIRVTLMG